MVYGFKFEENLVHYRKSSCNGDSGGPLIAREVADDPCYQIGLVSFGTRDCGTNIPPVYTKVAAHMD